MWKEGSSTAGANAALRHNPGEGEGGIMDGRDDDGGGHSRSTLRLPNDVWRVDLWGRKTNESGGSPGLGRRCLI